MLVARIVEEVGMLLVGYPWAVRVDRLLVLDVAGFAGDPTREYYALGGVFDEDAFRLDSILGVCFFQRRLTALEIGFV
jgi:hypothetical protein